MLTVESATFLTSTITTFLANIASVAVVGSLRSRVASWCGDDTAEQMGLDSFNPLAHIDVIFLLSFMIFGIGLGQYPMINPQLMRGSYKHLKFYVASFINTGLYLFFSALSLALLLIFFGPSILELFRTIAIFDVNVMRIYPELSSVSLVLALIGVALVHINGRLAVFSVVINLFRLIGAPLLEHIFSTSKYRDLWVIAGTIVFIYFLFDVLHLVTGWIILTCGYSLAYVFGVGI